MLRTSISASSAALTTLEYELATFGHAFDYSPDHG